MSEPTDEELDNMLFQSALDAAKQILHQSRKIKKLEQQNESLQQENQQLKDALKWIKQQYDDDYYPDEPKGLFGHSPRDRCIYEKCKQLIK